MTRWIHEKRRVHPHGLLPILERMMGKLAAHKSPVRRARTAARGKGPTPRGSMTRVKM
jgi:hypothetical protein